MAVKHVSACFRHNMAQCQPFCSQVLLFESALSVDASDMQARSKAGSDASKQGSYFGQNVDKLEDLPPLPKPSGQCCALSLFVDAPCLLSLPEVFGSSVCMASCSACSACCLDNCTCDLFPILQVCVFLKHACLWVRSVWPPEGMAQSC